MDAEDEEGTEVERAVCDCACEYGCVEDDKAGLDLISCGWLRFRLGGAGTVSKDDRGSESSAGNGGGCGFVGIDDLFFDRGGTCSTGGREPESSTASGCGGCDFADIDDLFFVPVELGSESGFRIFLHTYRAAR